MSQAARHSRRQIAEREALQAQLEINLARIERLQTEVAELEADSDLRSYRSRDSFGSASPDSDAAQRGSDRSTVWV